MPGAGRARVQPHRLYRGQPKREERRKGGACIDPHGFDGGKLIKGKKRHVLVDTLGRLVHALVTSADVLHRDGGIMPLSTLYGQFPYLKKLFANSAYAGPVFHNGRANVMPGLATEIVGRCDRAKGFVVLSERWIVERTIGWLGRCRRLAKGWENLTITTPPLSSAVLPSA